MRKQFIEKNRKTILLLLISIGLGGLGGFTLFSTHGGKKIKDAEFAKFLYGIEEKEQSGITLAYSLISLCEELKKIQSYDKKSDDFIYKAASSQVRFQDLASEFSKYSGDVPAKARTIAQFYADYCELKINIHAKIKEVVINNASQIHFAEELAKNAQNDAKAEKLQAELQIICKEFSKQYSQYFTNSQKEAICSLLFNKFKSDIEEYERKVKHSSNKKDVKMLSSQWPQVILYKTMTKKP